jgi:hypothetical protein
LSELPEKIAVLEGQIKEFDTQLADPSLYREAGAKVADLRARHLKSCEQLAGLLKRWEELESRNSA